MFILKTLKKAPTCIDLIQIIFRELVCSLLTHCGPGDADLRLYITTVQDG